MNPLGLTHLYCGDGKGKTTAALGLLLRASGAGMPAVLVQFLKGDATSELASLALLPGVTVLRGAEGPGWSPAMSEAQRAAARAIHDRNLAEADRLVRAGQCRLIVLDEAAAACRRGLVDEDLLRRLVLDRPEGVELVLTGRRPPQWMLDAADYVTEMRKLRHPFERGIAARVGVEK